MGAKILGSNRSQLLLIDTDGECSFGSKASYSGTERSQLAGEVFAIIPAFSVRKQGPIIHRSNRTPSAHGGPCLDVLRNIALDISRSQGFTCDISCELECEPFC